MQIMINIDENEVKDIMRVLCTNFTNEAQYEAWRRAGNECDKYIAQCITKYAEIMNDEETEHDYDTVRDLTHISSFKVYTDLRPDSSFSLLYEM